MRILAVAIVALTLVGCGTGVPIECEAIDQLEALSESMSSGAFSQALDDNDLDAMSAELDTVATEADAVRDSLEGNDSEAAQLLVAAASSFVAGANLLDETMSRTPIREDDLDAALQDLTNARDDLGQARRASAETCVSEH